ncbi:MAG TPA: FAD-dependent oxidoreductase, partial [Candidatus Limnocylindrales bacterium]|nr:FAD-dependent oxidoreductase [Candidatus Limnocylindrales bacterium]
IPDEGIIDPFWLTRGYAEAAVASGAAAVRLQTAVTDLVVDEEGVLAQLEDGSLVRAEQVFDCAGISADEVAAMAGDRSFAIAPRKGQFLVSEETFGVDRIVLPIPGPLGKGMLVTPIVFGGVLLGPTAEDITDKDDRSTDGAGRSRILDSSSSLVPAVRDMVPIRSFAGLRHVSSTGDYILRPSAVGDRLWIVAGIRSTGISASPAIAEEVVRAAMAARGWARPSTTLVIAAPPLDLPDEPGEVVCLCRSVSRGEILAAIRRPIPAVTLDAVKRRCGAMLGDCQGNMCSVDVARIVAHEGGLALTEVEKGARGSWIFSSEGTRPGGADGELPTGDVVIIGARHAGSAAAEELSAAGLRTVVVERHEGHTAIGIVPGSADTTVLVQSATGTTEVRAQAVIVATGGFVEPGEHRAIDGGRPAGVVTWDFAMEAALRDHGIGDRRVYVVGRTTLGRSLMESSDHGPGDDADFVGDEPGELLGAARLEAIRSGDRWIDCDTLVFADRQVANTMLLRSLGVVDGRPGVPAPVDRDGRLPIRGIYAAGCCVRPDIDHERCAADGAQVGRFVAMELKARATG